MAMHQARVVIAVASTAVALGGAQEVNWVSIKALKDNQGVIKVGKSTVTCDNSSATDGRELWPGDPMFIKGCDLAEVFINGKVVGDGVGYCADS